MLFIFFWEVMSWIFCIAFPFVILMSQNYIYLEKQAISQYLENFHSIWEQKVAIFVDVLLEKTALAQRGTILESHRRLDKIVYGESSVKVSC